MGAGRGGAEAPGWGRPQGAEAPGGGGGSGLSRVQLRLEKGGWIDAGWRRGLD